MLAVLLKEIAERVQRADGARIGRRQDTSHSCACRACGHRTSCGTSSHSVQRQHSTLNFHLVLAPFLTTSMLQTAVCTRILEGVQTDILLQAFADRVVVLVTQLGKVGSLVCPCFRICSNQIALTVSQIQATMPSTMPLLPPPLPDPSKPNSIPLPAPPPSLQLTPLLGSAPSERAETLHSLYASQIATLVWTLEEANILESERRAVIVGIALSKAAGVTESTELSAQDRSVFRGVMDMVRELLQK